MANYRKLGKNVLIMTIGSFGSRVISFVFVPFYTAVLTTAEYGVTDLITTTATLLLPLFTLTVFESMMRFPLDQKHDPAQVWQVGCRVEAVGLLAFLALSPLVLLTILREYYGFVVAYYVAMSVNRCVSYYVRGVNKVTVYAVAGTLHTLFIVLLSLLFLLVVKIGIVGYLLAHVIASLLSTGYMFLAAKLYRLPLRGAANRQLRGEMLRYSIPLIPNSVCWWIANVSDRYILTAFADTSATGVYSVAYKIPTVISALTSIFGNAWKLSAVEDFGSEKSREFFSDVFSKLAALMVLAASFLLVVNKPLARVLFQKDFYAAWQFVPILLLASVMHAYAEFFGSIYTSSYRTRFLVISTAVGSGVNILLNFLLIPRYQGFGAAVATLIGYAVIWLTRVVHSRRILILRYHVVRDALCYALVIGQAFIACRSYPHEYLLSGAIFVLLLALMHRELLGLARMLGRRFLRRKG